MLCGVHLFIRDEKLDSIEEKTDDRFGTRMKVHLPGRVDAASRQTRQPSRTHRLIKCNVEWQLSPTPSTSQYYCGIGWHGQSTGQGITLTSMVNCSIYSKEPSTESKPTRYSDN